MNSFKKNKLIFVRTSSQKSKGYETTETIPPRIVRHIDCLHDRAVMIKDEIKDAEKISVQRYSILF